MHTKTVDEVSRPSFEKRIEESGRLSRRKFRS